MATPNTPGWPSSPEWDDFTQQCERVLWANERRSKLIPRPVETLPPEHYEDEESDEALEVGVLRDNIPDNG